MVDALRSGRSGPSARAGSSPALGIDFDRLILYRYVVTTVLLFIHKMQ